ncbi:MAG: FG-GAP repeat protein [Sandaracinaceae bacterium]|nr:FG-GAP repeat protein [Sandaracinaceae bacterium]
MSVLHRVGLVGLFVLLGACSDTSATLQINVITGLVPGPEFRIVQTQLLDAPSAGHASHVLEQNEAIARFGMDYAHGQRVASFTLADGAYRVRVRLMRPNGSFLVERTMAITLAGDTVLPVHITRDCVGVECPAPGGSAELNTCLEGRCVDERCSLEAPVYCPDILFCNEASQCGDVASCAEQACVQGVCTPNSKQSICDSDQWCNPDPGAGCEPLTPMLGNEIVCGTICVAPGEACRFGYWNCRDGFAPFCDDLLNRPSGHVCGVGRVCDSEAQCVVPSASTPGILVTPTAGLVTSESGASAMFSIRLATRPSADVTIDLSSSDASEGVAAPASVVLTPDDWDAEHVVVVTGVDDPFADGDIAYTVVIEPAVSDDADYNGFDADDVSASNIDNDVIDVTVTPSSGLVTTEQGGEASFTVVLTSQPTASVSISVISSDTMEGTVSPSSVTFTTMDWSTPQTVTVTGVNDFILDGDTAYSIVTGNAVSADTGYDGRSVADVSVTNRSISYIKASNTGAADYFGWAIALSSDGNTLAVGAYGESSNATGIDGNQTDNSAGRAGAVYIYTHAGSAWIQQAYLKASNTGTNEQFGYSLALSSDGNTLAVGANQEHSNATGIDGNQADTSAGAAGAVYVFTRAGSAWTQQAYVKASNTDASDYFGYSVALASDGNTLAVGAWSEDSIAIGIAGNQADNSAGNSGAAYVFVRAGSVWTQQAYVKSSNTGAGDDFGTSIALSSDGNTLAIGAQGEKSNATGVGGGQADNSATFAGAAYVLTRVGAVWSQQAYVKASNTDAFDLFGYAVALSSDGNTLAVAAQNEGSNATGIDGDQADNSSMYAGAVYVFTRAGAVWSQQAYVKGSNTEVDDSFGTSVALSSDGNMLTVGAFGEASNARGIDGDQADNSAMYAGAAYVFTRAGAAWVQQSYVKASNTDANAQFGRAVAMSADGSTVAIGSFAEASGATGIDGNQADNSAAAAGAVYVYQ